MRYAGMGFRRWLVLMAMGAIFATSHEARVWGQATTRPAGMITEVAEGSRYLFEDKLKPGMKGYGLTVMHAGKIDRFDVEIIDVVKNFMPGTNVILVRCSGLGLEH